jgi:hypothetical protein
LRRNIGIPASGRHAATGLERSLTSVMHTKRAASRQFRSLLRIDLVYAFSNVDPQGDLMLVWLLPSFILTLNRVVGRWHTASFRCVAKFRRLSDPSQTRDNRAPALSMIRKSGYRFSEKIMLKQKDRAG